MLDWIVILTSAGLSIALPVAIIYVRQTVKTQRQDVINDLAAIFEPKDSQASREHIIPSFEFVKFKYSVPDDPNELAQEQAAQRRVVRATAPERDFSKTMFVVASMPLMVVLFALGLIAFGAVITLVMGELTALNWVSKFPTAFLVKENKVDGLNTWLAMLAVAYIAGYLYIVRDLLRAVANFELSPMTLLMSAIHVLFGVVTTLILASVASEVKILGSAQALLLAAFAVGFVPELGVRTLLRATKLRLFKSEDDGVYNTFSATPVEVIDGIDTEVRSRLSLHNIVSVQNLATANPIMLFVETPYGVYQIIDWVAQAQLCSALGPKAVIEFWKLGIRTIFDLERALMGASSTRELRHEVGKIIVLGRKPEEQERLGLSPASVPADAADKTVLALASIILDDLHIQRLRQIANRIAERLGLQNLHLTHIADQWKPMGAAAQPDQPVEPRRASNGHATEQVLPRQPDEPAKLASPKPAAESPSAAA
jgi:hypothetical protein